MVVVLTEEDIEERHRLGGKEITYVSEKTGEHFRVWVSPVNKEVCPYCKSELSKIGYMCDCYRKK